MNVDTFRAKNSALLYARNYLISCDKYFPRKQTSEPKLSTFIEQNIILFVIYVGYAWTPGTVSPYNTHTRRENVHIFSSVRCSCSSILFVSVAIVFLSNAELDASG